jgi:hypothetical protein
MRNIKKSKIRPINHRKDILGIFFCDRDQMKCLNTELDCSDCPEDAP